MAGWTSDELTRIGRAEEVDVAAVRPDGSLRKRVTVWLVREGDELFVRSAVKGSDAAWFRGVQATHEGRIWAGAWRRT